MSPDVVIKENMEVRHDNVIEEVRYHTVEKKSTKTTIPFVKNNNFDYAQLVNWAGEYKGRGSLAGLRSDGDLRGDGRVERGEPDGRPGRPGGGKLGDYRGGTRNTCVYVVALRVRLFPEYHVHPRAEELVVFAAAFIGATVGFLWYNAYPAQVFMGDTGSLTLGGIIAVFAIIIRKELLIPDLVRHLPGGESLRPYADVLFQIYEEEIR